MAKREYIGRTDLVVKDDEFDAPRTYSDHELRDFHGKIQRFWGEPREVNEIALGRNVEGTAQKFCYEDLAVAFGAVRKVPHGTKFVYQYEPERYRQFCNLWKQYEEWRKKQDWIDQKNSEGLVELAVGVNF